MHCPCCPPENVNDLDHTFKANHARRDAGRYLKKGLDKRGRKLIAYLVEHCAEPVAVLDIGCGAGGVHHELLRRGVAGRVVGVEASSAYLEAAQANATHLGLGEQVVYRQADFAQAAEMFDPADVVIMDRVICCYPYLSQLLGTAARQARRYLALSFPIDAWWLRLGFRFVDILLTLFRSKYHPYLHAQADITAIAQAAGLQPVHLDRSGFWQIMIFARTA